jgi:AhpD family alkylhydroperoxidase
MKTVLIGVAFALLVAAAPIQRASAEGPPEWMKQIYPEAALQAAWEEEQAVDNPKGALDAKTKQLIGLGVAAQIPCQYCIYYHTLAAKHFGATDAQIKEALAAAALTRKWSTVINGSAYDMEKFKQSVNAAFAGH